MASADAARTAPPAPTDAAESALVALAAALSDARPAPSREFLERLDEDMWDRFADAVARARPALGESAWAYPGSRAPASRLHRPIQVMVGDAHELYRTTVMSMLEAHPMIEVIGEADTGDATMRLALWLKPDVVVFDPRMLDGEIVLERLRAELPQARAIVLTADESMASEVDPAGAGAACYVSKRTALTELREAVIDLFTDGDDPPATLAGDLHHRPAVSEPTGLGPDHGVSRQCAG